jgi:hypothetical protein
MKSVEEVKVKKLKAERQAFVVLRNPALDRLFRNPARGIWPGSRGTRERRKLEG